MTKHDSRKQRGFTLIELSVVVVIIGIIISVVATVLPSLIVSSKIKKARAILEKIDYAIQGYSIANNRLPFAAAATDGIESSSLFTGYLPYHSLGLSSGQDPWGNEIRYAVYGAAGGAANLTATFADATAFCTALSQASTAAFNTAIAHTTTATSCASADAANSTNQAFILISGGPKDMDGANGFLDGCNSASGMTFNAPNKIMDTGYDDLVEAFSLNELIQRMCSGSGSGGSGSSTAAENTYTDGCTNGTDDDGDGNIDCADSDCASQAACSGPGTITITTTTIPSVVVGSSYAATLSASGGTAPYEWTLTNNGGLTGLSLSTYTGALTGTIDQCPGTYNIIVDAQDSTPSADSGPLTDSATLALQVTGNLALTRTSGSGTTITWSSTLQQETFQASGVRLGNLNWSLDSGGASGFTISASGSDGAVLKKSGASSAGAYTFVITATDSACSANSASLSLTVTISSAGAGVPGGISNVSPSNIFTPDLTAYTPDAVRVSDTVSAVAFSTAASGGQGYIRTTAVNNDGSIGSGYLSSLRFESGACTRPELVYVAGNIYAVAYSGPGNDGWIRTVTIDGNSGAVALTGYSLEFDTLNGEAPSIVGAGGNLFAVAYISNGNKGTIKNLSINTSTGSLALAGNTYEFESVNAAEPDIVNVTGTLFAVAYRGPGDDGWLKTISIDAAGNTTSASGSLEFDVSNCFEPVLLTVNSSTLAVAYRGTDTDGWLRTISVDTAGTAALTGSSLEFDPIDAYEPDMVHMGGDIYAIAYRAPRTISSGCTQVTTQEGWISTVGIASNGVIGSAVIDTLEPPFETSSCYEPSIVRIDADTSAIFYRGPTNRGVLVTVGFQ